MWGVAHVTLVAWGHGYQGRQGSGGPIWAGHTEVSITSAQDGSPFLLSLSEFPVHALSVSEEVLVHQ